MGPFLFLVYINDIFNLNLYGTLILFADDAVLINTDTNPKTLEHKMQHDIIVINKWLINNRLTLNTEKNKIYANQNQLCAYE